ncbi:hypothetical protein AFE_0688 [Acidithiobacillus ferrooxidans ATCC 23270]|uniref:Uncharacterized protein n=1 Tax=Acidithiobacillus ferrooxidans (strain ATCC 23270 / DSM 14882 / CIP 104768 / NCIMB 8455) TaxID=243159 RepID=B7J5Y4_ACIF2|nr:hypothetical protein AFE_0688 [Acidithiobacillus ferrooxidans ATCC 23270]
MISSGRHCRSARPVAVAAEEPVMISYPCNDQTPMPPLSDEAAVTVLEFLQRFTECFESQY